MRVDLDDPDLRMVKRVGVVPFEDAPGADAGRSGQVVSAAVTAQLKKNTEWGMFERSNLKGVVGEMAIQSSSMFDPDTAVKIGKLMGVQSVVVGNVSQYEIGSIPFLFFLVFDKNVYRVGFSCRMIMVETGEVMWSASTTGTSYISMEDAANIAARKVFEPDPEKASIPKSAPRAQPPAVVEKVEPVEQPVIKTRSIEGRRWAVVVGVSDYSDSRIPTLRYAAADAQAFSKWLVSPNGGRYAPSQVKLLANEQATSKNIKDALFVWLKQVIEEDIVTIYFAGHGSPDSPDTPDNLYLLTHDTDYGSIATSAFPMWDIETALSRFIKAKKVIVLADACHSGGVGNQFDVGRRGIKSNSINSGLRNLSQITDGVCVISASDDKQMSQESKDWGGGHGAFTFYLLKGLGGEADYTKDGHVTLGELTSYLSENVRRATKSAQSPTVAGKYDPALAIGKKRPKTIRVEPR